MRCAITGLLLLLLAACSGPPQDPAGETAFAELAADGRWTIINYWAIWCAPCREEIPELNEFAAEHADKVIVYGVNYDNVSGEDLLVQATELAIEFPLLATDPASQLEYARPTVLPTTIVINPEGEVWARLLGPQTVDDLVAAMGAPAQKLAPPVN